MIVINSQLALVFVSALLTSAAVGPIGILTVTIIGLSFYLGVCWGQQRQEEDNSTNKISSILTEQTDIGSDEPKEDRKIKRDYGTTHVGNVNIGIPTDIEFVHKETQTNTYIWVSDVVKAEDGNERYFTCGSDELGEQGKYLDKTKYTKYISTLELKPQVSNTQDSVYGKTSRNIPESGSVHQNFPHTYGIQQKGSTQQNVSQTKSLQIDSINKQVNSGQQGDDVMLYNRNSTHRGDDAEEEMEIEDWSPANEKQASSSTTTIEQTDSTEVELYNDNLKFYQNKICTRPFPGQTIEDILSWKGDYKMLENEHSYIQWLFPTPVTSGHNFSAQELYLHEAEAIRNDEVMHARVLRAYKMMLDFYGMELVDETSGEIRRCEYNWKGRYAHLNTSYHNYMRITRILISLAELGYERCQVPLVRFVMTEALVTKELPNLNSNSMDYWITAIKDGDEMFEMMKLRQNMTDHPELFDQTGNTVTGSHQSFQ